MPAKPSAALAALEIVVAASVLASITAAGQAFAPDLPWLHITVGLAVLSAAGLWKWRVRGIIFDE